MSAEIHGGVRVTVGITTAICQLYLLLEWFLAIETKLTPFLKVADIKILHEYENCSTLLGGK